MYVELASENIHQMLKKEREKYLKDEGRKQLVKQEMKKRTPRFKQHFLN